MVSNQCITFQKKSMQSSHKSCVDKVMSTESSPTDRRWNLYTHASNFVWGGINKLLKEVRVCRFFYLPCNTMPRKHRFPHRETSNHFTMWQKYITTGVREGIFANRQGDYNHLLYLTSVPGHQYLFSVPGQPSVCFLCRASANLDTKHPSTGCQ